MDNWTFGITMIVVGMGGTILTLWILSILMSALKKLFPIKEEEKERSVSSKAQPQASR
jgi:Na+-transporting methylmalonyl-CoA/oxaloacetate decarboxylase gamma subunit